MVRPCVLSRNLQNEEAQTRKGCKCRIEEEEEEEEEEDNSAINDEKCRYKGQHFEDNFIQAFQLLLPVCVLGLSLPSYMRFQRHTNMAKVAGLYIILSFVFPHFSCKGFFLRV